MGGEFLQFKGAEPEIGEEFDILNDILQAILVILDIRLLLSNYSMG